MVCGDIFPKLSQRPKPFCPRTASLLLELVWQVMSSWPVNQFHPGIFKMSAPMGRVIESDSSIISSILDKFRGSSAPDGRQFTWQYTGANGEVVKMTGRQELIAKLVSTCLGLAVSLTFTYFGFKYLANVLDPTRQEKKEAQKRVSTSLKSKVEVSCSALPLVPFLFALYSDIDIAYVIDVVTSWWRHIMSMTSYHDTSFWYPDNSPGQIPSQEAFLGLPWVCIRTFGPRELGLWVWPGTHQSPSFKL